MKVSRILEEHRIWNPRPRRFCFIQKVIHHLASTSNWISKVFLLQPPNMLGVVVAAISALVTTVLSGSLCVLPTRCAAWIKKRYRQPPRPRAAAATGTTRLFPGLVSSRPQPPFSASKSVSFTSWMRSRPTQTNWMTSWPPRLLPANVLSAKKRSTVVIPLMKLKPQPKRRRPPWSWIKK